MLTMPRSIQAIEQLFFQAVGQWRGCQWTTHFGSRDLNLEDLNSAQARIVAQATSGEEASQWYSASRWLKEVETDAQAAENEAIRAMGFLRQGQWSSALDHFRIAYLLEQKYRPSKVWFPLYQTLRDMMSQNGQPE